MHDKDRLRDYRSKRNFRSTPEPSGRERETGKSALFVVQKHDASHLHYDFRLEVEGALASWAVPKGPSTNPEDKRLAVRTEDHPLEYSDFEGVIPKGGYGAGTVLVWDTGTFRNLDEGKRSLAEGLDKGHVAVWLEGKKLQGGFALTRMNKSKNWLLVKMRDEKADARRDPVKTEPESVISGRDLKDIKEEAA